MECFAKIVKNYNYFSKALYLRSLTGWCLIRPSFNKYLLFYRKTSHYVLYETNAELWQIQNPVFCSKFSHILTYSRPFHHIQLYCQISRTLCSSYIFWYIQSLRYIQNFVKAYSGIFRALCNARTLRTLPYSELRYIQNSGMLKT